MSNDSVIASALHELAKFHPKSIFLYGSRGRGDAMPDSDYELGVIFDDDTYIQRSEIHAAVTDPKVRAYPVRWGKLEAGSLDHVFQKSIFLNDIILGGRTLAGQHLIEKMTPPAITTLDLIQALRFDIGLALAALLSFRAGDMHEYG